MTYKNFGVTNQISVFDNSRWHREVQERAHGGDGPGDVLHDDRSSHQDCDTPHVHQLQVQDLHPEYSNLRSKLIVILLFIIFLYLFRYLKPERNLRNSTSCCIMCYLLAFMGFGLKVAQSQLYISNMKDVPKIKKKTQRRMKCSRLSTVPTRQMFMKPRTHQAEAEPIYMQWKLCNVSY